AKVSASSGFDRSIPTASVPSAAPSPRSCGACVIVDPPLCGSVCPTPRRNAMSESRFTTLTPETMSADQKRVADAIQSGPRGAGLRGPFNALRRRPGLGLPAQRAGAYVGSGSSIPPRLNEMAIIMAGRKWTAQYEFYAHRRLALEAGLSPAIADAIAA